MRVLPCVDEKQVVCPKDTHTGVRETMNRCVLVVLVDYQ